MAGEFSPISVVPTPNAVLPGGSSSITVNLSGAPTSNESVNISTNQPSVFTDLPSSVVVPAHQTSVSFTVHTSASASGSANITASTAGGQAVGVLQINVSNPGS